MKRRAVLYLSVAVTQRGVGFLMLPFFVRSLSPSEYGAVALIVTVGALMGALLGGAVEQAVFRWSVPSRARSDSARALVRLAAIYTRLVLPAVAGSLAMVVWAADLHVFEVSATDWAIELWAVGFSASATYYALPLLRARDEAVRFLILAGANIVAIVAAKSVLVIVLGLGVRGWVIADLLVGVLFYLLGLVVARAPRAKQRVSRQVRSLIRFSLPLVPHVASFWVLSSSSRALMAIYLPLAAVGIFSAASNIVSAGMMVLGEVNRATLNAYASRDQKVLRRLGLLSEVQRWLAVAVAFALIVGSLALGQLLFPPSYAAAVPTICLLSLSIVAYGWYLPPINELVHTHGRTTTPWRASAAGAGVMVLGTLVATPVLGVLGVILVSVSSYLTMWVIAARVSKREQIVTGVSRYLRVLRWASVAVLGALAWTAYAQCSWQLIAFAAVLEVVLFAIAALLFVRKREPDVD